MTLEHGAIFSELRAKMLSSIPEDSTAAFRAESTIGEWLGRGAFFVKTCSNKRIAIEANKTDYGNALLIEYENYNNHCAMHLNEILHANLNFKRTNAWMVISFYYFGFFAAHAFLRLIGEPILFLLSDQLRTLQSLAESSFACPHQGTFQLAITKSISLTNQEITLCPTDKVHEATWKKILGFLKKLKDANSAKSTPNETLLYDAICSATLFDSYSNHQWPSLVRNKTNYKPGFAYKLNDDKLNIDKFLEPWKKANSNNINSIIYTSHSKVKKDPDDFIGHVELMVNVSLIIFLLTRDLYNEFRLRHKHDKRWEHERKRYLRRMGICNDDYPVLLGTDS